jgi:long-chain acyl-CoA synthetase
VTIVERIREQARGRPEQPAIIADGPARHSLSYAELLRRGDEHARRLTAAGIAPGDRCGLMARQGAGFVEAALGVLAAGGCLVPIPDDTGDLALEDFARRAHLHYLLRQEGDGFAGRGFDRVAPVDGAGDEHFRALAPAYLRFTSGTTSQRKGVTIGHPSILRRLEAANRGMRIGPDDRILWLLPMAHHFVVSILLYLSNGATLLLPAGSLARSVLRCCADLGATVLYASPFHYNLLAKDASDTGLGSVRLAVSTAERLRRDVAGRFLQRYRFPIVQALGIIEVGLAVMNLERAADKPEALGRPLPDYDVWLRAEDGSPVREPGSPEKSGEICIRGPGLFDAYLDPWMPAGEVLRPDGFRTGDQGWFDADGDLHLAGRRANRINMAGMKFFSEEVEAVLDTHPGVRRSRVLAREHAHLGEIPVAEIVPTDPASIPTRQELTVFCRQRLPAYKIPRHFEVVENLPLTPTGKLRRPLA